MYPRSALFFIKSQPGLLTQLKTTMQHKRATSTKSPSKTMTTVAAASTPPDWQRVVSDAERLVGYPTSFLSLRWLLSDEIANIAIHMRKLAVTDHPLVSTAKQILYNSKNLMHAWGLIVLLVSKTAGHAAGVPDVELDKCDGVLHSQRALAEIIEMIRISHLVHNSVLNLQQHASLAGKLASNLKDMAFGNKVAMLTGDYLLSRCSAELSSLRNQEVVALIVSCVRDFVESEYVGERDEQNNPLPYKPGTFHKDSTVVDVDFNEHDVMAPLPVEQAFGNPSQEWEYRNVLNAASLLGKSCQAALILARQHKPMQRQAYRFGKHLALAWQAYLDVQPFECATPTLDVTFNLVSAPVLFHLEHDPDIYMDIEKGKRDVENIDYDKLHKAIINGPGLAKTKALQHKHMKAALNELHLFSTSGARQALENIILNMYNL